jgi:hypothetical protein
MHMYDKLWMYKVHKQITTKYLSLIRDDFIRLCCTLHELLINKLK